MIIGEWHATIEYVKQWQHAGVFFKKWLFIYFSIWAEFLDRWVPKNSFFIALEMFLVLSDCCFSNIFFHFSRNSFSNNFFWSWYEIAPMSFCPISKIFNWVGICQFPNLHGQHIPIYPVIIWLLMSSKLHANMVGISWLFLKGIFHLAFSWILLKMVIIIAHNWPKIEEIRKNCCLLIEIMWAVSYQNLDEINDIQILPEIFWWYLYLLSQFLNFFCFSSNYYAPSMVANWCAGEFRILEQPWNQKKKKRIKSALHLASRDPPWQRPLLAREPAVDRWPEDGEARWLRPGERRDVDRDDDGGDRNLPVDGPGGAPSDPLNHYMNHHVSRVI